jgi:hypothetical protein
MQTTSVPSKPPATGYDLLRLAPIRALVRWRGFPYIFQVPFLALYVALLVIGWGHLTPEGIEPKLYAKTNLVNLVIWGLWWPAMIWVTFFLGRAWCAVCPLELVSSLSERLGRKFGLRQRPLGGWLLKGSLVVCFFALLQLLVPGIHLHRVPHYTSIFLAVSLGLAFAIGLLLKDRAFCRGFCPVALLLSAYGRGGMLAARSRAPAEGAEGQPCAAGAPPAGACPSLLNPGQLSNSKDCLICGQCIKAAPADSMRLLVRPLFSRADAREPLASWPLTLFVMVVSGFVTYELCGVWPKAEQLFLFPTDQLPLWLVEGAKQGWVRGVYTIFAMPLFFWLGLGLVTRIFGGAKSLGEAWRRLALPLAVVVAGGHMAKGLEKFSSWAGFLPYALAEPTGLQTAQQMSAKLLAKPTPWLTPPLLSVLAMLLVATGIFFALREARLADPVKYRARLLPILMLGGFYFLLVFGWGGWVE